MLKPTTTGYVHQARRMYIRDRFIIKVSSLHGSSHINLGFLLSSRRRGLLFFGAVGPPTRVRWRARLSFRENVISKTFVTHMHGIQTDVSQFFFSFSFVFAQNSLLSNTRLRVYYVRGEYNTAHHISFVRKQTANTNRTQRPADHLHVESVSCYDLFCR